MEQFIPPGAVPLLIADGKLVLGTADITDLLDRYGISYVKQTEHAAELFGNFGIFQSRPAAPLAVPRDQYLEAIDLIRRDALNEPMPDPPPPPPQEAWICPHCHEKNPPNFELCWNCGQAPETDQQP